VKFTARFLKLPIVIVRKEIPQEVRNVPTSTRINGSEIEPYVRHFTERLEEYYWTSGINAFPDAGSGEKNIRNN
jgi:hypothetical protein